ncbi:MAG TPA: aminomethyl-transferring glycine dehydrogenase subunit GcvPA [Firmicutes bacterium]|jgi:glycine dehydrogenase subunit 1|nr:aminomethyl-transferring glycine dehydrogenase subunit GcvPA [Bacillota bacterium]
MNHPYLPLTDANRAEMLKQIGVESIEKLLTEIPDNIRLKRPLNLQQSMTEPELSNYMINKAAANHPVQLSFLGAGAYQHYIPAVIDHLANRSEFYTSYTPYQPEISQGMLQAIFEYQTFISELFGLPIANASLYDGPSALAEAVLMAVKEVKSQRVLIPENISPNLLTVIKTYTRHLNLTIETIPSSHGLIDSIALAEQLKPGAAAVVLQSPNFYGLVENIAELIPLVKHSAAIPICYVHPLTLSVLEAPGNLGAEIVVAEGQPLGLPLAYGGPYLGLMATSERFIRRIPGRLVGETVDHHGKRAFVLTLQTREQHIRREKATSNICSNQALCALRAAIYLSVLGPLGLKEIAQRAFDNAHYLFDQLKAIGFKPLFDSPFFMEFAIQTPKPASFYIEQLLSKGILAGLDLAPHRPDMENALLICATEVFSKEALDQLIEEMRRIV